MYAKTINRMKIRIIILTFIYFWNCSKTAPTNNQIENSDFKSLVNKIEYLTLDFILLGIDKGKYHEYDWDENGNLIENPLLEPLSDNDIVYVESKYDVSGLYKYHWIYKYEMKSSILLVMKQSDTLDVHNWIMFNLYNLDGELLDTLSFGGRKYGFYYMDGLFYKDMRIVTRSYHDLLEDSIDIRNFYATEITREYMVQDSSFQLLEKKSERALFTNIGERRIYTRVDTLKFYY